MRLCFPKKGFNCAGGGKLWHCAGVASVAE